MAMSWRWARLVGLAVIGLLIALPAAKLAAQPTNGSATPTKTNGEFGNCTLLPADNPWNSDISAYPVDPKSTMYINSIGAATHLHPDFGSDPSYGIPYVVVSGSQPFVPMTFTGAPDESDPGPYPIPANAPIENGDGHVLVVDSANCKLYETYSSQYLGSAAAGWSAYSGAVFDLTSNALRPDTWTSADAAGLPIFIGLARFNEVQSGVINHALRFTVKNTQRGFIHPATHFASASTNLNLPPMGLRLRLKANFDLSHFTGNSRIILTALKKYGMILADNGSNWFITGSTDTRWNDDDLNQIKSVPGSAFEAVYTGPVLRSAGTPTPQVMPTAQR